MRHKVKTRTLGRSKAHRLMMIRNMAQSLFDHSKITTTKTRAEEVSILAEKLITWARLGDLHSKRMVFNYISKRETASKLFDEIAPNYKEKKITSGYTRMIKTGYRKGDNAPLVILQLV